MAFGATGTLAIDLGSHRLRLVHGEPVRDRLRVYDFAAEELLVSNPEGVIQQLGALVQRKNFGSLPVAVAISGPEVVHRLLDFPSMPSQELGVVVGREMRSLGGVGGKEVVFDWEVMEESEAGGVKQARVLVALAPRSQVDGILSLLDRCRLAPFLLTTSPVALLRSLKVIQGGGVGLRVVLYMGESQSYILGVKDGVWSFYREFSSKPLQEQADALVEEALKEANRALLYYRQRHRETEEPAFFLCGEGGLGDLLARLRREMGVEGEIVQPGLILDTAPLGERAGVFTNLFPSFVLPLGLVTASAAPGVNLLPQGERKRLVRRRSFRISWDFSFLRRPALPLAILVLLALLHSILVFTERRHRRLLENRAGLYAEWLPAIRAAEEGRTLRDNEMLLAQALGSSRVSHTSWEVLFKLLSRLAPSDLVLHSVNLQRETEQWRITLKGEVLSSDLYTVQAAFNRFYQGLKSSPYLERIELLPLDIGTVTNGPQGATKVKAEAAGVQKTRVQFEVQGYLKSMQEKG